MAQIIQIERFSSPVLDIYTRSKETQLLHRPAHQRGLFIAESPIVIERALAAGYVPESLLMEDMQAGEPVGKKMMELCGDIPVYTAPLEVLKQMTGFSMTRGMLCAMYRNDLPSVEEICQNASRIAVLEDVVNPTNVGAIMRSAAALNMDAVLLTPDCSDPLYRRAIRVSMGTVFQIPWTFFDKKKINWKENGIDLLHRLGFQTAAMALSENSVNIDDERLLAEEKLAVILGTEGDGLAMRTIASCDYTVCIPMSHGVDSLNVAAASAVAFWQLGNNKRK